MSTILKINEIGTVLTGKTPKTSNSEFWDGNLSFYTPSDMDGRRHLDEVKRYLTEEGIKSVKNSAIPPNSVMVSCIGSDMGKVSLSVQHGVTNQQINTIIPNEEIVDFLYLYYSLLPRKSELQMLASGGSAQPILNKTQFSKLEVVVPSLQDQKVIAHILGTLDDKIELNQKMNQTLEEIAKAIFKSWFVDFDPVRAKAEGRSTNLPPEISDLFPDELADSEIGEIPRRWEVKTISDLAECVGGATPSTKNPDFWEGGNIAWTSPKDLSAAKSIHLLKTDKKITEAGLRKISSGLLPIGTVLLSSRAPVGYLALTTEPTAINQGYIALKPKSRISNYFLLNWCESHLNEIKNRASGTTFSEISKAAFRPIPAIAPSSEVMEKFHELTSPIYERALLVSRETETLGKLRDTLLPKLISGELRIPDAEQFLEEAGI